MQQWLICSKSVCTCSYSRAGYWVQNITLAPPGLSSPLLASDLHRGVWEGPCLSEWLSERLTRPEPAEAEGPACLVTPPQDQQGANIISLSTRSTTMLCLPSLPHRHPTDLQAVCVQSIPASSPFSSSVMPCPFATPMMLQVFDIINSVLKREVLPSHHYHSASAHVR